MAHLAQAFESSNELQTPRYGPLFFTVNALLAWIAVFLSLTLALTGYYAGSVDPAKPTILGNDASGVDTPLERFLDWITYFTIVSNVTVAVVMTTLVVRPGLFVREGAVGAIWRALRLDSVLMIVTTGAVYNVLLVEGGKTGWDALSNTMLHVVMPLVTPLVWIIVGPRGLLSGRTISLALVLPLAWAAFALVRGQAVGAYPYRFLDIGSNGAASVLIFIGVLLVLAVLMALVMWAVDAGLRWTMRAPATEPAE